MDGLHEILRSALGAIKSLVSHPALPITDDVSRSAARIDLCVPKVFQQLCNGPSMTEKVLEQS